MKVVIAGSRDIRDAKLVHDFIDRSPFKITEVVSGGAAGVDRLGEVWAKDHNVPVKQFTPKYHALNPLVAPLLRNIDMAEYADALLAVWKDKSNGTHHMIEQMDKRNKPYRVIELTGNIVTHEWGAEYGRH